MRSLRTNLTPLRPLDEVGVDTVLQLVEQVEIWVGVLESEDVRVLPSTRLTPVRSTRYSERAPSKQYDRRVSRSPVEPLHLYYEGTTTRPHARTNAEKQEENRRTEPEEETPQAQRHLSCVTHPHACEAQSRLREKGPSGGLGR